jgi:uroporphyrinogen-III decarboxylase
VEQARLAREAGALVVATMPGAFDTPRELMGDENACLSYYEQPDVMKDILDTITDTTCRVLDRVSQRVQIDQLSVHEDLAGKSGPLVGPTQVVTYFLPYYRAASFPAFSTAA